MSTHRIEIEIDVDDDALAGHDGDVAPPPNDVSEWDASDLFQAARMGIVRANECNILDYTCVKDHAR